MSLAKKKRNRIYDKLKKKEKKEKEPREEFVFHFFVH